MLCMAEICVNFQSLTQSRSEEIIVKFFDVSVKIVSNFPVEKDDFATLFIALSVQTYGIDFNKDISLTPPDH